MLFYKQADEEEVIEYVLSAGRTFDMIDRAIRPPRSARGKKMYQPIDAFLCKTIIDLINSRKTLELQSGTIWRTVKESLPGHEIDSKSQRYYSLDYDIISQKQIIHICLEVFGAVKTKHHGANRKLVFSRKKLDESARIY